MHQTKLHRKLQHLPQPQKPMKKHIGNFLKLAVSLGIGVSLVLWFLGQMSESDKQHVIDDIKRADYFWVILAPVLGFISNYFRAERWRSLLKPLGHTPGAVNTFLSVMIMYFLNLFFPRLGEVSRCGILARYENIPLDKAIGTMVLERLADLVCITVIAGFLFVAEHDKFLMLYDQIVTNSKTTFADIIAKNQISDTVKYSIFGLAAFIIAALLAYQIKKAGFSNIVTAGKERALGLLRGIISIKDVESPFMFLFHTIMIWVCYYFMAYVGFRMFPETSGLSMMAGGVCLFFSGVAYSLTPGGLGLFPIFMQIILGLYGVVGSAAMSLGLVVWSVQTGAVIVTGLISLILLTIINREPSLNNSTTK